MGSAIREVLQDLWWFALGRERVAEVVIQPPFRSGRSGSGVDVIVPGSGPELTSGRAAYVLSREAVCYTRPLLEFDSRVGTLRYGESVFVDVIEDEYARVRAVDQAGWVRAGGLTNDWTDIEPYFTDGKVYDSDHVETSKLRAHLDDALDGGALTMALQPSEYVLYRLLGLGIVLDWPPERPRLPGQWQTILRGHPCVRMGIDPKTNSIMECGGSEITPLLGFVEAVSPEGTVTAAYVEPEPPGMFRRRAFSATEWRELRPIYISIV